MTCLDGELAFRADDWARAVDALAGAAAERAAGPGWLAQLGILPGEPPVTVVLAARRELIATHIRDALTAGRAHRAAANLWLTLPAGTYLADALDPGAPLDPSPETVVAIVSGGKARHGLLASVAARGEEVTLSFSLYSSLAELRASLSAFRCRFARRSDPTATR